MIVEKVVTLDTASVLENRYAVSEAVVSGGRLSHSLATKGVREPVKVEKALTPWQTLKMKTEGVCLLAILLIIIYFVIRQLFNLNLFKL